MAEEIVIEIHNRSKVSGTTKKNTFFVVPLKAQKSISGTREEILRR